MLTTVQKWSHNQRTIWTIITSGIQCQWEVFEVCRLSSPSGSSQSSRNPPWEAFQNKTPGGPECRSPAGYKPELDHSTAGKHRSSLTGGERRECTETQTQHPGDMNVCSAGTFHSQEKPWPGASCSNAVNPPGNTLRTYNDGALPTNSHLLQAETHRHTSYLVALVLQ